MKSGFSRSFQKLSFLHQKHPNCSTLDHTFYTIFYYARLRLSLFKASQSFKPLQRFHIPLSSACNLVKYQNYLQISFLPFKIQIKFFESIESSQSLANIFNSCVGSVGTPLRRICKVEI